MNLFAICRKQISRIWMQVDAAPDKQRNSLSGHALRYENIFINIFSSRSDMRTKYPMYMYRLIILNEYVVIFGHICLIVT